MFSPHFTGFDPRDPQDIKQLEKICHFTYSPSDAEPPCKLFPTLKLSAGEQPLGMYATERIRMGQQFQYNGKIRHKDLATDSAYTFAFEHDYELDALQEGNLARFINHSFHCFNMTTFKYPDSIKVEYVAIQDIEAGEQLLISYGKNYYFSNTDHIILHPTDGYIPLEEIIKKNNFTLKNIQFSFGKNVISGAYYCSQLVLDILEQPGLNIFQSIYSKEFLYLPLIVTQENTCAELSKQTWITPLMLACALKKPKIVKSLLQRSQQEKIDILNMVDAQHNTVLAYAMQNKKCFMLILQAWKNRIHIYLNHPVLDYRPCFLTRTQEIFKLRNQSDYSLLDLALLHSSNKTMFFQIAKIFQKIKLSPAQHIHEKNKNIFQNQLWINMVYKFIFCLGILGIVTHSGWLLH